MSRANIKTQCSICNEEEDTYPCNGCSETYCFIHLVEHRENIKKQFDQIEDDYNSFRQTLYDQKDNPEKFLLIRQIDKWKNDSIKKIEQITDECKQRLFNYTNKYFIDIENKSNRRNSSKK
jgi:hypothetical protein